MNQYQIFTIVGILGSLLLGVMNYSILRQNRKNNLRELVFKEQVAFLIEFIGQIGMLSVLTEDLDIPDTNKDEKTTEIIKALDEIHFLLSKKSLILNTDLYVKTKAFLKDTYGFALVINELRGDIPTIRTEAFRQTIYSLEHDIRGHLGIDKLSDENKKINN